MIRTDVGDDAVWAFAESEHRDLSRGLSEIHELTTQLEQRPDPALAALTKQALGWLHAKLEPHLAWEEAALFAEIDDRAGTPWATRCARVAHQQLRSRIAQLEADWSQLHEPGRRGRPSRVLADLAAVEALLRAHIELEEDVLFPVLTGSPGHPAAAAPMR
jgi:hemerythrin-like domain-containing protein